MAKIEVGHNVGLGQINVVVQKAQRLRLDRAAQIEGFLLEGLRQFGDQGVADFVGRGAVQDEAERAFLVVLADEDHGAMEEGAVQFALVEDQLPFQGFGCFRHFALSSAYYGPDLPGWQSRLLWWHEENHFCAGAGGGPRSRGVQDAFWQPRIYSGQRL